MIDKIRFAVRDRDHLTKEFRDALDDKLAARRRSDGRVEWIAGLPVDYLPYPDYPTVKGVGSVGFIGTAKMSAADMTALLGKVFVEPDRATISRIDFAVDVPDLGVLWWERNLLMEGVRTEGRWAKPEFTREHGVEQVRWGSIRSPRYLVAYDKLAETDQKGRAIDPAHDGAGVVTRVEIRLRGDHVPARLRTLPALLENITSFEAFPPTKVVMRTSDLDADSAARFNSGSWERYRDFRVLRALVEDHGANGALAVIRRQGGNAAHYKDLLSTMPPHGERKVVDLNGLFQASVVARLQGGHITTHAARRFVKTIPVTERPLGQDGGDAELKSAFIRFATETYPQFVPAPSTIRGRRAEAKPFDRKAPQTEQGRVVVEPGRGKYA